LRGDNLFFEIFISHVHLGFDAKRPLLVGQRHAKPIDAFASYDRCPISQRTTMRTSPGRNPKSNSNSAAAVCACIPQVVIGVSVRNEETALA
jgi:hypothetical protein